MRPASVSVRLGSATAPASRILVSRGND